MFNMSNNTSNMRFKANSLLDVTNMQNMQNHMHNMHNMQSWFQYVGYALPLFADVVLDHGVGLQHWITHKFMKIKVQYPFSIHDLYQIYTASRNIHWCLRDIYLLYTSSGFQIIWILAKLSLELWYPYILMSHPNRPDIGAHFLKLWYRSCCDIGVFQISDTLISGTMILEYHWYWRYCDIGVYPTSEVLWYRGFSDITAPLISEFTSCDIRIYWYHSSELW
jgi:hypothetical protein